MITPSGEGTDRFYVMSLSDFNSDLYWYYNAYGKMNEKDTSTDFGAGVTNTAKMIEKWNENKDKDKNGYGLQNVDDIWGQIQEKVEKGWFVPSKDEWSAFGGELGIRDSMNSFDKGLKEWYWTSSQYDSKVIWGVDFTYGLFGNTLQASSTERVRLSTTF